MGIAHLAFELGARHEGGNRIDHHDIDRAGAHQRIGDLERLLARVRLRDQEVFDLDAELPRIARVERVLGVDERADAAELLGLGDGRERQRRLARAFRTIDFDDPPARQPANTKCDIEPKRTGRDRLDLDRLVMLAEPHDRALAEGALDLAQRRIQCFLLVHATLLDEAQRRVRHLALHHPLGCTQVQCGHCTGFVLECKRGG